MKKLTTLLVMLFFTAGMAIGQNNETTITQVTSNNSASVDQLGMDNEATITQKGGNQNVAHIDQSSDPNETGIIISTIFQDGANNDARTVGTRKNSASSETEQRQVGSENIARINQGLPLGTNRGTTLTQVQVGNLNFATMSGNNSYQAEQRQVGNRNDARTSGGGKNANIFQEQLGNDNIARINGLSFASSDQLQFGDRNLSILENVGHDGPGESYLTRQDGNDNDARLTANGNGGVLDVRQTGNLNTAIVDWTTSLNTTTINQNGFQNTAVVNSN